MSASVRIAEFVAAARESFVDGSLLKLKLAGYLGAEVDLKSVEARKIVIKAGERLSLVYRYKTRDITKNLSLAEAETFLTSGLANEYRSAKLETVAFDLTFERQKDDVRLKRRDVKGREAAPASHDRAKNRPLTDTSSVWLKELGITGADGKVLSASQDKFRQINKMVEIFAPLIQQIGAKEPVIMDMGAGKGYLDFALADYFKREGLKGRVVGIEMRPALVDSGNALAKKAGFDGLSFAPGMILDFDTADADAIIALHACDTATDDAIFKGITSGASLIAVAPCCHKQVRRSMEAGQADERLDFLLRHGTFLEKQAEMVTDGLRALILEVHGYRTKVFEFISDAHTPKNNLIVAQKGQAMPRDKALERIASVKAMYGIDKHYLEGLMGL